MVVPSDPGPGAQAADGPAAAAQVVWSDALQALLLMAIDPPGLGGVALRASAGPVRDAWLAALRAVLPPDSAWRRVPLRISDERLLGGIDLTATLQAGRPVALRGLLAEADGGVVQLIMAERLTAGAVAHWSAVMDQGALRVERDGLSLSIPTRFGMVALDEGQGDDDICAPALLDRLAFHIDLSDVSVRDTLADLSTAWAAPLSMTSWAVRDPEFSVDAAESGSMLQAIAEAVAAARLLLPQVSLSDGQLVTLGLHCRRTGSGVAARTPAGRARGAGRCGARWPACRRSPGPDPRCPPRDRAPGHRAACGCPAAACRERAGTTSRAGRG